MIIGGTPKLELQGLGDTSTDAPSRLTWFVLGAMTMLFAGPLKTIVESTLGLGHAGLKRAHRKIGG